MSELSVKQIPENNQLYGYNWGLYEGTELVGRFANQHEALKMMKAFNQTMFDRHEADAREAAHG
jgi:hypothetical protein